MPASSINDLQHWRDSANEIRALVEDIKGEASKQKNFGSQTITNVSVGPYASSSLGSFQTLNISYEVAEVVSI